MLEFLISLLVLIIVVVVVYYIIDLLGLPHPIPTIAKLILGLCVLIYILYTVTPMLKGGMKLGLHTAYEQSVLV